MPTRSCRCSVKLDDYSLSDGVGADITLIGAYIHAEPAVSYSDGSGCPPSPAEFKVWEVYVTNVRGVSYDHFRTVNNRADWFKFLDDYVWQLLDKESFYEYIFDLAKRDLERKYDGC